MYAVWHMKEWEGCVILRIGVRGHDCRKQSFESLVADIREQGFCCTQLALRKAIHEFSVDVGAMTPGMALYMREKFAEHKVDVAVLGCYLNLANPNPNALKEIQQAYMAHIRFASLLGCGVVGTETGAVNEAYVFEPANHSEEALNIFIENLKPVVEYAEKMGVIFAIEPVYSHIVSTVERTRKVLDAIPSPNLQVIFDPVNILSVGNHNDRDVLMEAAIQAFGKEIAVLHAKDYIVEGEHIISVPAGQGGFGWEKMMQWVKVNKPYIHVLLEDTKPENAIQAKEYMERCYQQA